MASPGDWQHCAEEGCAGVVIDDDGRCIGHTSDDEALERVFADVAAGHPLTAARGAPVSPKLLERLLEAAPRDQAGDPTLVGADFRNTTFTGDARFDGATFTGDASFGGAAFTGEADFERAKFSGGAWFEGATFTGDAWFDLVEFSDEARLVGVNFGGEAWFGATFTDQASFFEATFTGDAWFEGATFTGDAGFDGVTFRGHATFDEQTFTGDASFDRATFSGEARFKGATFSGGTWFKGATFSGGAWFDGVTFSDGARFERATFHMAAMFRLVVAARGIHFDVTRFEGYTALAIATPALGMAGAKVAKGGRIEIGWGALDLTNAEISVPVLVDDGAPTLRKRLDDCPWVAKDGQPQPATGEGTKAQWAEDRPAAVKSLRRAIVSGLQLGPLDLQACRFSRAHDLDRLRLPHTARFQQPPSWWRSRRQVLEEEIVWRRSAGYRKSAWARLRPENPALEEVDHEDDLQPEDVAELYRSLRIGREARGDAPGAADFYYGEMEMRRRAATTPRLERWLLWLYWALSGYALRASRALTALAVVVALSTTFLALRGYKVPTLQETSITGQVAGEELQATAATPAPAPRSWDDALWTSLEAVTLRSPATGEPLTELARRVTTTLRFIGPVLLGLAVLSVRGRVKR